MEETLKATIVEPLPTDTPDLLELLESGERGIEVCQKLRSSIDRNDERYVFQNELASEGAIPILFAALASKNGPELIEICETISAICSNIEGVSVRKRSGLETGFLETSFNPVQDELADVQGIRKLVNLLGSDLEGVKESANQCLLICCSFNHQNTVSYLQSLVHDVLENKNDRLEYLNACLQDIEIRDDVKVLMDQLMIPVMAAVRDAGSPYRMEGVILLGILCERHPASTTFLCEEGAIQSVVQILLQDDEQRGRAIQVLWGLIRHNKDMLNPSRQKLGVDGISLINPLVTEISRAKKPEITEEQQEEDFSDEALLILKALAEQNEEVRENVGDLVDFTAPCSIL